MAEIGLFDTAPANGHKIVIIDGHALAYRSYYAIRELRSSKGQPTNAIFGFIRALLRILKEEGESDATVITFDAPAKTFRHQQYEAYKAGRTPTPEDLPAQIAIIKQLIDLLGLHRIEVPGLEADDLFGTIAKRCEALGYQVEIITSDRDAYQLISDRITVRGLDKTERFGPEEVYRKYGVTVAQWVDYRALTGDPSDNIPGAKGIGPASAKKLLQRYGSLDYILAHLDEIEPTSYAEKIKASLDAVRASRELSRIVTDADIAIAPEVWAKREIDRQGLAALLGELEFGSVLRELGLSAASAPLRYAPAAHPPQDGALGYLLRGESAMQAELIALAAAAEGKVASIDPSQMLAHLESAGTLNACDAKALCVYAKRHGLACTPGDDPLLMAYLIDPSATAPQVVAQRYGAPEWGEDAESRAVATAELLRILPKRLNDKQLELYARIEKPLQAVLADMELIGVALDTQLLKAQSEQLAAQLSALEARIRQIADDPQLNVNSRDQLAALLFDKLKLQAGKRTATGKRSTAVSALEPLAGEHEVVRLILEYRELAKLKSTYLDPLPSLVHPETGRLHTTFNQTVVATGRLSSANPNLQNIPVRTEIGRQIRRAFIARPEHVLLVADYSQIELRILAHIAEEPALIAAFERGEDIHARTASQLYGVAITAVTPEMRRVAKVINFGVLYGMSAHRLTRELGISYEEAERYIHSYFAGYPQVRRYIDATLEHARRHGYVETLLGRRRLIPDINASNRNAREYAERTAYNTPIQGTAADIMKLAMVALAPKLSEYGAHITLQVHDELVIEAPKAAAAALAPIVQDTMQQAFTLRVPLVVELGVGDNWLEAK